MTVIESIFITWALSRISGLTPGNIITAVIFILALIFVRRVKDLCGGADTPPRERRTALFLALIYTTLYISVDYVSITGDLQNRFFRLVIITAVIYGTVCLFYRLLLLLFHLLKHVDPIDPEEKRDGALSERKGFPGKILRFYVNHMAPATFLLCLLCYLPFFLYQFPGIMTPDSMVQLMQTVGEEPVTNHHPLIHTLMIGGYFRLGRMITGSDNGGMAFYTALQMLFMAFSASYLCGTLRRLKIRDAWCLGATLFYALIPYHGVFAVTVWKDVPFAGIVLCFVCALIRLLTDQGDGSEKKRKRTDIVTAVIFGTLFPLFRSNAWYAFLFFVLTVLYLILRKKRGEYKVMLTPLLLSLLLACTVRYPVMMLCHIPQADLVESLSIPLQQVAAVITYNGDLAPEDRAEIEKVVDISHAYELYEPTFSDNIKELVRAGDPAYLSAHKGRFLILYLRTFLKNPVAYYRAYVQQTVGYYFPDEFYRVADMEGICPNNLDLHTTPLIGGRPVVKLKEILLKLGNMLPLYSLLWSMGVAFWILLFFLGLSRIGDRKGMPLFFLPYLLLVLTVLLATPVATEFRYVYFLVYGLPLYPVLALCKLSEAEKGKDSENTTGEHE